VVALLSCLLAIYATGMVVLIWALFGAVSTFSAMGENIVAYATILCHVSIFLAFVASADRDVVPDLARVPGDYVVHFQYTLPLSNFSLTWGRRILPLHRWFLVGLCVPS
jgi:hypothetical protein